MTARWRNDISLSDILLGVIDTSHVMQAIDVIRHSRITQQLVPSITALSFLCCSQFACKKMLLMSFGMTLVICIPLYIGAKILFCYVKIIKLSVFVTQLLLTLHTSKGLRDCVRFTSK